jgi:hypothetical protein
MKSLRSICACALLGTLAAYSVALEPEPSDQGTQLGPRHPAVLAGRLDRLSADGSTVDLHRPLDPEEAAPLAGYRSPDPFGFDEALDPIPRRGSYRDLHRATLPWGPRRRANR